MDSFAPVFQRLRQVMLDGAAGLPVARDAPGDLVVHARTLNPKTKPPELFGAVTSKRSYVAYHLFPLYLDPARLETLSPGLNKRRQGKSCFNFKAIDDALFAELLTLTADYARR